MEYFFSSDHHFGHKNIIRYCNRPFSSVEEMNEELITRHNEVVKDGDIVIIAGDFFFGNSMKKAYEIINRMNGKCILLRGSHDSWIKRQKSFFKDIFEKKIEEHYVVVCHYALRVWPRSHYGSWHLYGHSHGTLPSIGKSMDIGVDTNNFYPYSFEDIKRIMKEKEDNLARTIRQR